MATIDQDAALDVEKLNAFVFRAVEEVGATLNTALVVMGDRLGLYRALAGAGPLTPGELADRTGTAERYVREWLNAQAAGGYVELRPRHGRYTLPPEQAVALTDETAPRTCPGSSRSRSARCTTRRASPRPRGAARASAGTTTSTTSTRGASASSGPATTRTSSRAWLPALDGVVAKLEAGASVADVGCGHGASTILMAEAFPRSRFVGSDYHAGSIETARDARARPRASTTACASRSPRQRATPAPATTS